MNTISLSCLYCKKTSAVGLKSLKASSAWQCPLCSALSPLKDAERAEINVRLGYDPRHQTGVAS